MDYIRPGIYGIQVPSIKHGILLATSPDFATGEVEGSATNKELMLNELSEEDILEQSNTSYTLDNKLHGNETSMVFHMEIIDGKVYLLTAVNDAGVYNIYY